MLKNDLNSDEPFTLKLNRNLKVSHASEAAEQSKRSPEKFASAFKSKYFQFIIIIA